MEKEMVPGEEMAEVSNNQVNNHKMVSQVEEITKPEEMAEEQTLQTEEATNHHKHQGKAKEQDPKTHVNISRKMATSLKTVGHFKKKRRPKTKYMG